MATVIILKRCVGCSHCSRLFSQCGFANRCLAMHGALHRPTEEQPCLAPTVGRGCTKNAHYTASRKRVGSTKRSTSVQHQTEGSRTAWRVSHAFRPAGFSFNSEGRPGGTEDIGDKDTTTAITT